MAISLNDLTSAASSLTALAGLVAVSPQNVGYQPQAKQNVDGSYPPAPPKFLFNYEGLQTVTLKSDITDHFIEDNTSIVDQVALRPEIYTTHGFIAELTDIAPFGLDILKEAVDRLYLISAYAPQLTATAQLAYNRALYAAQTAEILVNTNVSGVGSLSGTGAQNKQQAAFQKFYGYWYQRTLFTVQTPWAVFTDMAIDTLRAIQDEDSNTVTDFEITFKKLRFAQTSIISSSDSRNMEKRAADQASPLENQGTVVPQPSTNILDAISRTA